MSFFIRFSEFHNTPPLVDMHGMSGLKKKGKGEWCLSRLLPRFKRLPMAPDGSRWLPMAPAHTVTRYCWLPMAPNDSQWLPTTTNTRRCRLPLTPTDFQRLLSRELMRKILAYSPTTLQGAYIDDISVSPRYQGRGAGKALVAGAALEAMATDGADAELR